MLYAVRAFYSKAAAQHGELPSYVSQTGSFTTAMHVANDLSRHYGAALVVNRDTGARTWVIRDRKADA